MPRASGDGSPVGVNAGQLYERDYEVDDNGVVEFSGEPKAVLRRVNYIAQQINKEKKGGKPTVTASTLL